MPRRVPFAQVLLVSLFVVLTACTGAQTASPTPEPRETEPAATERLTEEPETQAPREEPTDTPDGGGEGTEFSIEALLARIPPEIIDTCEPAEDEGSDTFIQVHCELPEGSGADIVNFFVIVDADEVERLYGVFLEDQGVDGTDIGSCPDDLPAEGAYSIGDAETGR
ncbi:MAG: hypothetical protein M3295_06685, partial [Chloroflexota bacterium]|nr:hypothetical protein [Chloroflexota bacterium]